MITNNDINGWVRTPFGEGDLRTIIPSDVSKSCDIAVVRIYYWTIAGGLVFLPTSDVYHVEEKKDKIITFDFIEETVSNYLEIPKERIQLNSREKDIVQARQICQYYGIISTKNSLAKIGMRFGNRDHASCLHSKKKVLEFCETEPKFRAMIEKLDKKLIINQ